MDILEEIVANKRVEIEAAKQAVAPQVLHRQVEAILDFSTPSMKQALTASDSAYMRLSSIRLTLIPLTSGSRMGVTRARFSCV